MEELYNKIKGKRRDKRGKKRRMIGCVEKKDGKARP